MLFPDLSLTLSQRRRPCVLDPGLALCQFGLPLIRRLGDLMELWMPREFWHILDNSQFFLEHPESLFQSADDEARPPLQWKRLRGEIVLAIEAWERTRLESHLSGLRVFWIGDGLSESLIPPSAEANLLARYESLAHALDRQLINTGPMACAARDSAALAAALGTAFVLTSRTAEDVEAELPPLICRTLAASVRYEPVTRTDPLAAAEREYLRHLLVYSGSAHLLWSGLNLAVLHFVVPSAPTLYLTPTPILTDDPSTELPIATDYGGNLWDGARAFWYPL
jgi:hypothetical protein